MNYPEELLTFLDDFFELCEQSKDIEAAYLKRSATNEVIIISSNPMSLIENHSWFKKFGILLNQDIRKNTITLHYSDKKITLMIFDTSKVSTLDLKGAMIIYDPQKFI